MNKYIDAEKLIAEIERLKEETPIGICEYDKGEENGRMEVITSLQSKITSLQQEQPEVELDALVDEAFDKYSSVDGYGQLSASFNRAELYSFIKKIARKEE